MDTWGDAWLNLLYASISHHGRPVKSEGHSNQWSQCNTQAKCSTIQHRRLPRWAQRYGAIPPSLRPRCPQLPDTAGFHPPVFRAGCRFWPTGSVSTPPPVFFPIPSPKKSGQTAAPFLAQQALRAIGLDVGDATTRQQCTHADFAQAFGVPMPRPMQAAMADSGRRAGCGARSRNRQWQNRSSAVALLAAVARAGQVDALYFALPTRVAATQLYRARAPILCKALGKPHHPSLCVAAGLHRRRQPRLPGAALAFSCCGMTNPRTTRPSAAGPPNLPSATWPRRLPWGLCDQALLRRVAGFQARPPAPRRACSRAACW